MYVPVPSGSSPSQVQVQSPKSMKVKKGKGEFDLWAVTKIFKYENQDIAIAISYSRADPVLGLNILQG